MLPDRSSQSKEEGRRQEEGREETEGRKEREERRSYVKYGSEWRGSCQGLVLWLLHVIPGARGEGGQADCPDCLSVDVILFMMFLGAVTLGMFLSWVILWIIMRVSRKK